MTGSLRPGGLPPFTIFPMTKILLALVLALPARAEDPWFDSAALQGLSSGLDAARARIEAANQLPRIPPGSPEAQRLYNTLFPYYAEVCTVSQYKRKRTEGGGFGGHATMFLNGAELDSSAGYPRLKLAPEGADLSQPDSGVGISVNKVFANVNWVAIPGRDMLFRAGLEPGRKLDQTAFEAAIRKAVESGWFDGIEMHAEMLEGRPDGVPVVEFVVRKSIGTDFALSFARNAHCARLPLAREKLAAVIFHLNALNDEAREKGNRWDVFTNNCSHTPHNALAAAGVWDRKKARGPGKLDFLRDVASVGKVVAGRMSDFAFPANGFVRAYEAGNERPVDDVVAAFENRDIARTMKDGWSSTGPGALVVSYPMLPSDANELFEQGRDPFIFSLPLTWNKKGKFEKITADPPEHLIDLRANLQRYRERYQSALAGRDPAERDRFRGKKGKAFRAFYDRYYEHLARGLGDSEAKLAAYDRLAR